MESLFLFSHEMPSVLCAVQVNTQQRQTVPLVQNVTPVKPHVAVRVELLGREAAVLLRGQPVVSNVKRVNIPRQPTRRHANHVNRATMPLRWAVPLVRCVKRVNTTAIATLVEVQSVPPVAWEHFRVQRVRCRVPRAKWEPMPPLLV